MLEKTMRRVLSAMGVVTTITTWIACRADEANSASSSVCSVDSVTSVQRLVHMGPVRAALGRDTFPEPVVKAVVLDSARGYVISALSWGGPSDGAVLLLTCTGELINTTKSGYVFSLDLQQVVSDSAEEIIVEHQAGQGTGWTQRRLTVYGLVADTLAVLWSGVTLENSYQAEVVGAYEIRATVSYSGAGKIDRVGTRVDVEYDKGSRRWRPIAKSVRQFRETYTWSEQMHAFMLSK